MGWDNHLMTAPVGFGDISQAVGNSSLDLGTLIHDGSINKWAKYKPQVITGNPYFGANSDGTLTDAQRRLGADDGTYYGLTMNIGQGGAITQMHNTAFTFSGRPTTPPYRAFDFIATKDSTSRGYSDIITPNPGMIVNWDSSQVKAYVDIAQGLVFGGGYNPNNVNGIDMTTILLGPDGATDTNLGRMYPCLLLGNYISLLNSIDDNNTPQPLRVSSTNYPSSWAADLRKPLYGTSASPFSSGQTLQATLCLAYKSSTSGSVAADFTNMTNYWINAADNNYVWSTNFSPIPCSNGPSDCGFYVSLTTYVSTLTTVTLSSAAYNSGKTYLQVTYLVSNPTDTTDFSLMVTCDSTDTVTRPLLIRASQQYSNIASFLLTEFPNCVFASGVSNTYSISVLKNGITQSTQTYTIRY